MSWSEYVLRHAGDEVNRLVAAKVHVTEPTVSRWKKGGQGVSAAQAARFARAYDRPVLEAFVAADFLTADEAGERPSGVPDYTQLTNDELLELVRARMREEGESGAGSTPSTNEAGDTAGAVVQLRDGKPERINEVADHYVAEAGGDLPMAFALFTHDLDRFDDEKRTRTGVVAELNARLTDERIARVHKPHLDTMGPPYRAAYAELTRAERAALPDPEAEADGFAAAIRKDHEQRTGTDIHGVPLDRRSSRARSARTTGKEPGLSKARREHDEQTEKPPEDPTGMEPI